MTGLKTARIPGSLDEARTLVAYNERIRATSHSAQRIHRAMRMLANLRPHVERMEREERASMASASSVASIAAWKSNDPEYDVVWNGGEGLSSYISKRSLAR